ncbi:hypothetical protein AUC68_12870 [Methyloceanibacter methanicus]|uniref:Methyltransferase type 11 domain-containing protein n=1 Tax=Methyloceanibacter methanicus TaxID=1774968 RepID=A0A1E3W814_9HYPH|nr:hypothetical protein AUC68_12870 [Methyloceanibacter methanicus]
MQHSDIGGQQVSSSDQRKDSAASLEGVLFLGAATVALGIAAYWPIFKAIALEKLRGRIVTLGAVDDAYVHLGILKGCGFTQFTEDRTEFKEVLRRVGFDRISFLDVSDFEGADIIQDLSAPLDPAYAGCADLVLDNGTIEHCADPLKAIENTLSLLKVGGVAIFMSPTNGYLDHGFWQISPTLYFDLFYDLGYEILFLYVRASNWGRFDKLAFDYKGISMHSDQDRLGATFPRALTYCAVRKTSNNATGIRPIQSFYSVRHTPRVFRDFTKIKYAASEIADVPVVNNRDLVGPENFVE